jgi:hypothetical protein
MDLTDRTAELLEYVSRPHRPAVEGLWQLYQHDPSEFRGSSPDTGGLYKPGRLPLYWGKPDLPPDTWLTLTI